MILPTLIDATRTSDGWTVWLGRCPCCATVRVRHITGHAPLVRKTAA